ncbi:hypothetical protein Cob_v006153 [Colletotrichum orbiculare MAFF 240422]|uniref:Uncharacterized protein n=1 Tax=Colletotrichum orbiculare (strain 104-T / ATCC 96160 / CBS 514.97 / LARS 414 / MAFF 240422) TaxID=1213857 RepID=A0A484FV01_COLOR|nr:hypothetical protein Cob_v006153 [Colletotrichum orbiculare MAFF 240422]
MDKASNTLFCDSEEGLLDSVYLLAPLHCIFHLAASQLLRTPTPSCPTLPCSGAALPLLPLVPLSSSASPSSLSPLLASHAPGRGVQDMV